MPGGRPRHEPTDKIRRQVKTMIGFGVPQEAIAELLEIDPKTLRLYYRHELDTGVSEANLNVAQSLYNMAVRDKIPAAAIFWMKTRAGWKEPPQTQVSNTTVIVGGIDAPPAARESYADWLARAQTELAHLETETKH
jgi:hypothetical protein